MEINKSFQNLNLNDHFEQSYLDNDVNRKFYGVSQDTVLIRPTANLREINLGDDQWVKIIKIEEPIGLSTKEFESEKVPKDRQCRYNRTGILADLCVQDLWKIQFDSKSTKTIHQYYSQAWMGGLPILFKRLLTFCQTFNPNLADCHIRWCSSKSLHTKSFFEFSDLSWNSDPTNERYQITFGPVKSKLIIQDVNVDFDENGNRISGPEYHVQLEHNTLIVMSKNLKYIQYTVHPREGETLPIWLEFSNMS